MYSSQVGQKIGLEVTGNAIAAEPTAANHLATKNYVDSKAGSGNDQPILTTILF